MEQEQRTQELLQLLSEAGEAFVKSDLARLKQIWADDFLFTGDQGNVVNKSQLLAALEAGDLKYTSVTNDELVVRFYGDTAIITGRTHVAWQYQEQHSRQSYRFTEVFIRREGRWQSVSGHISPLPQE